ncbi:MAG TPA: hypothetical protein VLT61_15240 [Anaeromyxobacteraceae bacterium]|nr:hypothetical protein [Anaeromyxobacteraceae bacterium]
MNVAARSPSRRLLGALSSPYAIVALAAPLVLAGVFAVALGRGASPYFGSVAVRIWGALLTVSVAAAALSAAIARRWHAAIAWVGAIAILVQVPVWWMKRFDGVCDVGEGEQVPRWRRASAGLLATPPAVGVIEIAPLEGGVARVQAEGEVAMVRLGERRRIGGVSIRLSAIGPAPSFELANGAGGVVENGFFKLAAGDEGYMQFGTLPHRFQFSFPPTAERSLTMPQVMRVRIERGKLVVADRPVRRHEPLAFEGLVFRWGDGTRWARLEAVSAPRPAIGALGLLLVAGGIAASRLARRRS